MPAVTGTSHNGRGAEVADTRPDAVRAVESSIEALQKFHSTVIALALGSGVLKLITSIEAAEGPIEIYTAAALSVAFVSTIVPFYHGMSRHLHETHVVPVTVGSHTKVVPFLLDIFAFIIEAGLLVAMSRALDAPTLFLVLWSCLLGIDIVWSLSIWRIQHGPKPKWALNNFLWLVIAWLFWVGVQRVPMTYLDAVAASVLLVTGIAVVEVLRSVRDYKINWHYYFPWAQKS